MFDESGKKNRAKKVGEILKKSSYVENVANRSVRRFPHFLEAKLLHTRLIRGNGSALYNYLHFVSKEAQAKKTLEILCGGGNLGSNSVSMTKYLDSDVVLQDGLGCLYGDLVVRLIAVRQTQVIVLCVLVNK